MRVLDTISSKASASQLPFLVIGGYAVAAHGYNRGTEDLDLLVPRGQSSAWRSLLGELGFSVFHEGPTFIQFHPPPEGKIPIDLMIVPDESFAKMRSGANQMEVSGVLVNVVSLLHLIALKCHALQHSRSLRRLKDMEDLIYLIENNSLDLNESELRATILKYGNRELYESSEVTPQSKESISDVLDLELPDWSGMVKHKTRMTFAEAIEWNEEMLAMVPAKLRFVAWKAKERCSVEFVL